MKPEDRRNGRGGVSNGHAPSVPELKARQSRKIREIREALIAEGVDALDDQAHALGLCRSTTWTIVNGKHKASGLSASIIERMLAAPRLPQRARNKVLEYIRERSAGFYGGSRAQQRRFRLRHRLNGDTDEPYAGTAGAAQESEAPETPA